ncbi:epoxide hydrolase domain-containing protein [Lentinula raphanica]|uniref:Epoxide hydrolase domain-containing protein n=1 Tax=Lentinula raphanica TaxID=153919 RepID=A0AA38UH60_9AGAR|nr:epoxide hydrolase domain-containing protein [Lentinula raphanica]KAJ3973089.1 epoxide hydrolase domain-containing protein [Lentinula raphanica]
MSSLKPYKLDVSSDLLDWVTNRVNTARIIPDIAHPVGEEWEYGIPTAAMEPLVEHWRTKYDWRKMEKRINETFQMYTVDLEESGEVISLHFVHHRSERPDAVPLIFAHGWPGNFTEVEHLLKLTAPEDPEAQPFHIVAPSIPGFTLSSSPSKAGFGLGKIANIYHKLMLKLGYESYLGQGGDWGSFILRSVALQHPSSLVGLHINFPVTLPPKPLSNPTTLFWLAIRYLTAEEGKRLKRMQWFLKAESGYSQIQRTKPQTVSYALLDSPIGMLAWIREKMQLATEESYNWDTDTVITWTMLYLISGSAGHARIYKEAMSETDGTTFVLGSRISNEVAVGVSSFPKDVGYATKWWAEATLAEKIVTWRENDKGGHFPSVECPDALISDVLEWVKAVKETSSTSKWDALLKAGRH